MSSMYAVKLLTVIASLYFVKLYSIKSEIRFGYHLLYEHRGQLFHGLNRFYLLVGIDIPKFILTEYSYQLEKHLNCWKFVNMKVLQGIWYSSVPLCINHKAKEQQ